jgi:response regulator RpfG family c-di-GMP phosphodiesterase
MEENKANISVLYVDDEEHNLSAFKAAFRRDFTIFTALSAAEGKKILAENEIHVLFTDQRMPGTLGTELLAQVAQEYPSQIRMLLTGYSDFEALKDAINRGHIYKYLQKPWNEDEIRTSVAEGFKIFYLQKEQKELSEKLLTVNEQLEFMLRQKLVS